MDKEVRFIAEQLVEVFEGDPWFGRNMQNLLAEVNEQNAYNKPAGQHSMLELLWHIINWREFTISSLEERPDKSLNFEKQDWQKLDHNDKSLWQKGLAQLKRSQNELLLDFDT